MLNDLLIWGALLIGLTVLVLGKCGYGALTLSYFLILSVGHVPGLLAYFDANIVLFQDEVTKVGFEVTLIGMTAFVVGAMAARMSPRLNTSPRAYQQTSSADVFSQLSWRVLITGIVCYFVLLPVSALVPSLTSIIAALGMLLILGFWLRLYAATSANDSRQTLLILASLPLLPIATLATGGFLGFGTGWALSIAAFQFVRTRHRIWFYLATPIVTFLGLSLFVTYFAQREEIRAVTWDQNTTMMQRLEKISVLVTDFQLLDFSNARHLHSLDERLNQNSVVGVGVLRHRAGMAELWYGATIPFWALIPRVIWPDKPAVGGGQDLVSQFTGLNFAQGTSVGVGQVLEFYMNFGMPGVIFGFALLGFVLMRVDQRLMRAFEMRNVSSVTHWALPGLALLQPIGNGTETLVAAASAIITSRLFVRWILLKPFSVRRPSAKASGQKIRVVVR